MSYGSVRPEPPYRFPWEAAAASGLSYRPYTTGKSNTTEGFLFCRGPDLGHPAKAIFAEGRPSATRDPRQTLLRREPGPRQRKTLGPSPSGLSAGGPSVTAALGVRLCRGPGVKPSAKHCRRPTFAEGLAWALGKDFFSFLI